jgi:hypothetical protein
MVAKDLNVIDEVFFSYIAHRFGERYRFMFANIEEEQMMLSTLSTLISSSDVISNQVTGEFRL